MRNNLINKLNNYIPFNEQETKDRERMLSLLKEVPDIYSRSNALYHITVSGWTVNPDRTKTIMAYHNIYKSWAWLGGHADGDENLPEVAIKEVMEECGVTHPKLISDDIFSIEILTVDGHVKNGSYVPSHLHLNFTYLIEVDEGEILHIKEDENCNVKWFTMKDALEHSSEPWMKERIYNKLIRKTAKRNVF